MCGREQKFFINAESTTDIFVYQTLLLPTWCETKWPPLLDTFCM